MEFKNEEFLAVIEKLNPEFDSHDFIKVFIFDYPESYGNLLVKHKNVTTAHAEIAKYLLNHAKGLNIEKCSGFQSNESMDIFGNQTECAAWKKVL